MSEGAPWNYQGMPQETNTGSVQFFNPGQFQNTNQPEFDLTKQTVDSSQKTAINGQIPGQPAVNSDWNNWHAGWANQQQQPNQINQVNSVGQNYYQGQGYQDQTAQVQGQDVAGQNQFVYQGQGQYYDPSQQYYNQDPYQGQNWQQYGYYGNQQNWTGVQNTEQQADGSASGDINLTNQVPQVSYQPPVSQEGHNFMTFAPVEQGQGYSNFVSQDYHGDLAQENDTLNSSRTSDVSYDSTSCSQSMTDAESSAASGFFNRSGASEPLVSSGGSGGHLLQTINQNRGPVGPEHSLGVHQEISGESLRTVHESNEGMNENSAIQDVSDQLQKTSIEDVSRMMPPMVSITDNDINQSANKLQTGNSEKSESTSPQSDDQHGLSDWEVVPPQAAESGDHSRHDSLDNNVHFFIGSSKNSSTGSTPLSFTHGQNIDSETSQTTEQTDSSMKTSDTTPNQGNISSLPLPELTPQHSSSPNSVLEGQVSSQSSNTSVAPPLPPPAATPPSGLPGGGANPYRRDRTGSRSSSNQSQMSEEQKPQNVQQNILFTPSHVEPSPTNFKTRTENRPHLDMSKSVEPPSPIMSSSEESVHVSHPVQVTQKTKPQSPIMPRKESPFQPPQSRRRNLSQSSDTIEEQPKLEDKLQAQSESNLPNVSKSESEVKPVFNREDKNRQPVNRNRRGSGGGEQLEMQDRKMSDRERDRHHENRTRGSPEKLRAKPPPGAVRNLVSPRRIQNALQQAQEKRVKHNMSPATTLWADTDLKLVPNVILAPPTPASGNTSGSSKGSKEVREVLSPVENLITSLSEQISKESTPEPAQDKTPNKSDKRTPENRHVSRDSRKDTDRDRHERNSSIDRELEISRQIEEKEQKGRRERRSRSREGSLDRDRYDDDSYRDGRDSRYRDRRDPRDYDPYYDPRYRDPYRGHYRDQYYGDERYERPRSRESYLEDQERTPSRQGQQQQQDQTRSRQDYGRGQYSRDRYAYDQDYYARHGYYDQYYYDKYYARDARYASAYYDEYYKGNPKYNESFNRLMDFSYNWSHGYPPEYYDQHYRHGYDDNDRYSQRSHSRVNTPGSLSDYGDQDPYGYGSRSSSRQGQGYAEDPYYRGHYAGQYGQYDPYYSGHWNGYGYDQSVQEEIQPGRLTPEKYTRPHVRACLGPGGQLIKVLPNRPKDGQTAMVEVHELQALCADDAVKEELNSFPGPLIREETHKNDVLLFCQKKAKACAENINLTDRESAELIWRLLELLIKQNGTVVGTDISDLLLEGHEPTTVEYSMMGMKITQSLENLDEDLDETTEVTVADRSVVNRGRSREETTDRFRHLLLYGRKKDALEWAMKNNLWGHALFLASKMDSRAHANVMTRFANSAMKMNDPLQTLYQLMSGRQPAAVTSIVDEKWGDWRPHLAMILSNHTVRTDLDRKSITTLGDTLGSKGLLHASHLCYLMAQVNFGTYNKKTSKLVLIGSNHSLPLQEFATNEAIQCTEIYEYAMSLGNAGFYLPNVQYFKFLYATRLAENGFAQEALQYCEIMSRNIQKNPALFQPILVKLIYELANRLKYFDPQRLQTSDDAEDPFWLQQLLRISLGFEDGSIQPISGSVTPMYNYGTRASSESGEVANYTQTGGDMYGVQPQLYNQDGSYQAGGVQDMGQLDYSHINGQQNMYHSQQVPQQEQTHVQNQEMQYQHHQQYGTQEYQQQQQQQQQAQQQHQLQQHQQQQFGSDQLHTGHNYLYGQHQPQEVNSFEQNQGYNYNQSYNQPQEGHTAVTQSSTQDHVSHSTNHHPQMYEYQHQNQHSTDTASQQTNHSQHRNSITSTTSGSVAEEETDNVEGGNHENQGGMTSSFDYFGAATTGKIVPPRLRKRTESECSQRSTGSQSVKRQFSDEKPAEKPPTAAKKDDKQQAQNQSKGWFGGLFNRFKGSAGSNEMKLPDDKNPAIVWDPVKKRWMNKDGTEEDSAPTAPPPKDTDIHNTTPSAGRSNSLSTPSLGASMGPPATGNKYSKGKGRGARTQYVDVMNPKPVSNSTVPTSLFNVMPTVASAPAIFNPSGGGQANSSESGDNQNTDSSQQQTEPQTQQLAPPGGETMPTGDGAAMSQEGSGSLPMMFNPAQFTPKQNTTASKGGLQKYGQRRIYPK